MYGMSTPVVAAWAGRQVDLVCKTGASVCSKDEPKKDIIYWQRDCTVYEARHLTSTAHMI